MDNFYLFCLYFPDNLLTIHQASNITAAIPTNLPTVYGSLPRVEIGAKASGKAKNKPARIMEAPNKILISMLFNFNYNIELYHKIDIEVMHIDKSSAYLWTRAGLNR